MGGDGAAAEAEVEAEVEAEAEVEVVVAAVVGDEPHGAGEAGGASAADALDDPTHVAGPAALAEPPALGKPRISQRAPLSNTNGRAPPPQTKMEIYLEGEARRARHALNAARNAAITYAP